MYKVLIMDDKEYEREYLQKFISRKYPNDLEVVYTAADGEEALKQIHLFKPDLLLLDIIVPKLDGLEIAQQAKKAFPQLVIIMISAYADFHYAKQAMKIGVCDYLLKPYTDSELQETIDNILPELDKIHHQKTELRHGEPPEFDWSDTEEKTSMLKAVFDSKTDLAAEIFLSTFGSDTGCYKCLIFYSPQIFLYSDENIYFIKNIFTRNDLKVMACVDLSKLILILWGNRYSDFNEMDHCIKRARNYIRDTKKDMVFCGVSGFYENFEKLPQAYEDTINLIKNNTPENIGKILEKEEEYSTGIHGLEKQISLDIINKKKDSAIDRIKELYVLLLDYRGMSCLDGVIKYRLLQTINYVFSNVRGFLKRPNANEDLSLSCFLEQLNEQCNDLNELLIIWERLIEELTSQIGGLSVYNNVLLVKKAKEYIMEHYSEKISLQSITERLDISYGYLSKCFKEVEGISLTEYLNQYRIDMAKELMKTQNLNISEISYAVGFGDPNYFSKCFKKYTGFTPKEYWQIILVNSLDKSVL